MIAIRTLLMFSSLFVLSGCAEYPHVGHPCPPPGWPSGALKSCWYLLRVTAIDANRNIVTGEYVGDEVKDFTVKTFTFRVRDVDKLASTNQLQQGSTYVFSSVSNSAYLELYADQDNAQKLEKEAR
jgi:hypothetical protein